MCVHFNCVPLSEGKEQNMRFLLSLEFTVKKTKRCIFENRPTKLNNILCKTPWRLHLNLKTE